MSADYSILLPEASLAAAAIAALTFAALSPNDKTPRKILWGLVVVMVMIALWLASLPAAARMVFEGSFVDDGFSRFAKVILLLTGAAVLMISQHDRQRADLLRAEFPVLLALASVGMMVMVSAGDLMALYLGGELLAMVLYIMVAMQRDRPGGQQTALSFFMLGALSSGILLYGASLIYALTGSTAFAAIMQIPGPMPTGVLFGLVLVMAGLAFKLAAVPFHSWVADVYQTTPPSIAVFFATAPKLAAIALLARLLQDAFGTSVAQWGPMVALLAAASMLLGALAAIHQQNIKRMTAYLAISQIGFALTGLATGTVFGVQAMLLYMVTYMLAMLGVFAFVTSMEKHGEPVTEIAALKQLSTHQPLKSLALLVLFCTLAGAPLTLGFFARFAVLKAAIDADMIWLALAGALASVIGAFIAFRMVYLIYFAPAKAPGLDGKMAPVLWFVLMASAALLLLGVVSLFGLDRAAAAAAQALLK
ncbi:MAG: NADH-quinone oxidoreductase subunit N [Rhodobacterales bacterium]|nr:MAG: NADH-quinone oxidoreductase subunit N [Rhodobacterales bacterium]